LNKILIALALILASAGNPARCAKSEFVPLSVVHVAPLGDHQLIVYAVCSPEHCWHTFYIRKVEWSPVPRVVCRTAVTELNSASDFIAESVYSPKDTGNKLELHMVSSHDIFEPATVTLVASGKCRYQLGKLPAQAANNSFKPKPLRGSA
jgi:hypothetical protein